MRGISTESDIITGLVYDLSPTFLLSMSRAFHHLLNPAATFHHLFQPPPPGCIGNGTWDRCLAKTRQIGSLQRIQIHISLVESGSNSLTGHFIFYVNVCPCHHPACQRLTKNSLLRGESVALQRKPETTHFHNVLHGCNGKKTVHLLS